MRKILEQKHEISGLLIYENICNRCNHFCKKYDVLVIGNFYLQKRLLSPLVKKHPGKRAIDDALLKVEIAAGEPFD